MPGGPTSSDYGPSDSDAFITDSAISATELAAFADRGIDVSRLMPRTLIHSARIVADRLVRQDGWVLFDGDTIAATGQGRPPAADLAPGVDNADRERTGPLPD